MCLPFSCFKSASERRRNGDGAVVRRSGEASVGEGAAGSFHNLIVIISFSAKQWNWGSNPVRARGQEDQEGEAIQRLLRKRSAKEGEDDRAHQGQG